jgi:hypothetical protein
MLDENSHLSNFQFDFFRLQDIQILWKPQALYYRFNVICLK